MDQKAALFVVDPAVIGAVKIANSVFLVLTGYSFGHGEGWFAILIGAFYAGGKTFVENAQPKTSIVTN